MNRHVKDVITILFGNAVYALGIVLFVLPGGLITGGTTGIALVVNNYFHVPVSAFVFIFNICMFLLGAFVLGKKFALTTIISTFSYPLILALFERLFDGVRLTDDMLLNTVFAGICIGVAVGLVVKMGASTGGMDIPPLVLNKTFRIPVSVSMYIFDCIILLAQFAFADSERLLYGIILVAIYSILLEKILILGKQRIELKIVSEKSKEIKGEILKEVDRGVTLLHAQTGYLEKESEMILSVMSSRELIKVERIIRAVDPNAFLIISSVKDVYGHGFSKKKQYLP